MIRSFADKHTEELYISGRSTRLPADTLDRALRKLSHLDHATRLDDLRVPPGNRLHKLTGERGGRFAIAINDQWRICFRFDRGDVDDVEIADDRRG